MTRNEQSKQLETLRLTERKTARLQPTSGATQPQNEQVRKRQEYIN